MWLFAILIPAFIAYLLIDLYHTSKPAQDANELPEGFITMYKKDFDEYKARYKDLLVDKKWYERLLDRWQTQLDELGQSDEPEDYWSGLIEGIKGSYHELYEKQRQFLKDTVKKVTEDALGVIQEVIDTYEAQKKRDKEEIQRLTDENNRKDRDHAEEIARKDRDHAKELARKDQHHTDEMDRKDRQHEDEVAQYKADKARTLTAHQESMAEKQRAHNAQMRSQKSDLEAKHQEAITKANQDHDAQMDRQKSELTAKHSEELSSLRNNLTEKVLKVVNDLDDSEQKVKQQQQLLEDREAEWERHTAKEIADQTASLKKEIAELKAALKLAKDKASTQEPGEEAPAGPSTQGVREDSQPDGDDSGTKSGDVGGNPVDADPEEESPSGGAGQNNPDGDSIVDEGESNISTRGGERNRMKKRTRKNRGADKKGKLLESLSAVDRRLFIQQEAGMRSHNGRITFLDIDWAALTDPLEGWNGWHIEYLIEQA